MHSNPSWQVDLQCPQCGALVVIEETDRIFSCSFCRVRLYLHQEGPFRYFLPPRGKLLDYILFAPYWRFKGMVFTLEREGVTPRLVDSSLLALRSQPFPVSLGVRPQALRLKHLTPDLGGRYLLPGFPFQGYPLHPEVMPGALSRPSDRRPAAAKAFIGEVVSLIYAPFQVTDGVIFDAVLQRQVARLPDHPAQDPPLAKETPGSIHFMPMLCPTCGWDLEGEKNALVLLCRNCDSAWQVSPGGSLEKVTFAFVPNGNEDSFYLPFWQIRATIPHVGLSSFAGLVRFANLPKAVQSQWEEQPLAFWIPAFKIQPTLFLRLARLLTLTQPAQEAQAAIPRSPFHYVTLPPSEAVESIRVLLAAVAARREVLLAKLAEILIDIEEPNLVYFPFALKGTELIQTAMQMSISVNALNWGKLL